MEYLIHLQHGLETKIYSARIWPLPTQYGSLIEFAAE
jgi:hypothetical protein